MAVVVEIVVQEEVEAVYVTLTKRENATEVQPVDLPINSVSIRAEIKIEGDHNRIVHKKGIPVEHFLE